MKWNYEGAERGNCSHIPSVVVLNNDTAFFFFPANVYHPNLSRLPIISVGNGPETSSDDPW